MLKIDFRVFLNLGSQVRTLSRAPLQFCNPSFSHPHAIRQFSELVSFLPSVPISQRLLDVPKRNTLVRSFVSAMRLTMFLRFVNSLVFVVFTAIYAFCALVPNVAYSESVCRDIDPQIVSCVDASTGEFLNQR